MLRVQQRPEMVIGCRWRTAFADHMRHFDSSECGCSGMKCFETHHRLSDPLDKPVVLFKDIVEIFVLADFNDLAGTCEFQDRVHSLQPGQIGSALVNDNPLGNTVGYNGLLEKPARCSQIPALRQQEIKSLAIAVNSAIKIRPFSLHLDIGLVNAPGTRAVGRLCS